MNKWIMLDKIDRIFRSCTNTEQWFIACRYYRLAKKKFDKRDWEDFSDIYSKYAYPTYNLQKQDHIVEGNLQDRVKELDVKLKKHECMLREVEDDLYHICKFNVDIKSSSLLSLKKYMAENNIKIKD